jgi:hypothetical protein
MRVAEIDQGFVLAPPDRVYGLVVDPDRYPAWWPGVRADGAGRLRFPQLGSVSAVTEVVREGIELYVRVDGPRARGHLQWYLEPFKEGTIVYGVSNVETRGRWSPRRVLRHRASMRDALAAMKERLE